MKICHLTSVHARYDTRIFLKECRSLAIAGYETSLIVADGKGNEVREGVAIFDVGSSVGRIDRIFNVTKRVFSKAVELDVAIYHFHDPELIPIGLKLKRLGKVVVFDAHEDVPKQLLGKPYLSRVSRWFLSKVFGIYEEWACKHFDAIVTATPFIRDKLSKINKFTIDINNFPIAEELSPLLKLKNVRSKICYVGGITANRGVREIVHAMKLVQSDVRLELAGTFVEASVASEVRQYDGWGRVDELGFVDRAGVRELLGRSIAGLVTLHPAINYLDSLPIKMFEYMSAGIPVIASNFPLWREIIEGNDCGLCVDPMDPESIAKAVDFLVDNPGQAAKMGNNGRRAVQQRYNWGMEEKKLFALYEQLLMDKKK